jgi:hypothetical protein
MAMFWISMGRCIVLRGVVGGAEVGRLVLCLVLDG